MSVLNQHPALAIMDSKDFNMCFQSIRIIFNIHKQQLLAKLLELEKGTPKEDSNTMSKIFKSMVRSIYYIICKTFRERNTNILSYLLSSVVSIFQILCRLHGKLRRYRCAY